MAAKRPTPVDWEAIELRYRGGTESLRHIAKVHGITEGAIRQRAKRFEWTRDLKARVQEATERLLVRKSATRDVRTERDQVAVEAEMRSEVVLRHRSEVVRGRGVCLRMLAELEAQTADPVTLEELRDLVRSGGAEVSDRLRDAFQAVTSLPERVKTLKGLAEILPK